jgi:RHS repeat-associated protein
MAKSKDIRLLLPVNDLGSVVALSNLIANIVERYSYSAFGEPNRVSGVGNPYMFTGRNYDSETELYYYRARYYNPRIGRFLQTDPIGYEDGVNLYIYVANNPLNWTDPRGEFIGKIYHCTVCLWKVGKVAKECDRMMPEPPGCDAPLEDWIDYYNRLSVFREWCFKKILGTIPSCAKCIWAIPYKYRIS